MEHSNWWPTHHEIAVKAYENWKAEYGDIDTTKEVADQIWITAEEQLFAIHHRQHPSVWEGKY